MVAVQRRLEAAEGVDIHRAQGQMTQLRVFDRLPLEIEYLIQQYEQIDEERKVQTNV